MIKELMIYFKLKDIERILTNRIQVVKDTVLKAFRIRIEKNRIAVRKN